jgi:hypothetical protein
MEFHPLSMLIFSGIKTGTIGIDADVAGLSLTGRPSPVGQ